MPSFSSVNAVDYALIGLYFVILIWVGLYSARKTRGTGDYFKGGGKVPWALAGFSNWVSGFSAFMFVAAAGFTYRNGAGALLVFTSAVWAYLLGYTVFAHRWRRARLDSPLEFLTRRFSRSTTYFYSFTAIIPQIVGIGQGLYILCIFVATALGFSDQEFSLAGISLTGLELSILIVGLVMVVYTVVGGLWAAVLSDAVQSVIILTMTLLIFPISFAYLGEGAGILRGVERLFQEAPEGYLGLTGEVASPLFIGCYLLNVLLGYNVSWHMVQRYMSVPRERDARKMAMLCAVLSLVGPLLWILPVMASRLIFPDIDSLWPALADPAEASFVSLALLLLPHGMIGFVVSAIMSATLGQANDAFNWLAATFTRDVYVPLSRRGGRPEPGERRQLAFARGVMLVVGVLGIAVALYIPRFGGAFSFALEYYSLMAAFMMPVALGLVYTRTPWWSGIASCTAALLVTGGLMGAGIGSDHSMIRNVLSGSLTATVVFFGSAFWYRRSSRNREAIEEFARDLRTPVPDEAYQVDAETLRVYRMLAQVCLLLGIVLAACMTLPGEAAVAINGVAAALLLTIAAVLFRISRS